MKEAMECAVLAVLTACFLCGCSKGLLNVEQESRAIWEIRLAAQEALCTENTDAMMELWTEDATFGQPNGELWVGKEKVREAHEEFFKMWDDFKIEFKRLAISFPTPDVGIDDVSYVFTAKGLESHGRDTQVLVKRGSRWWIAAVSDFVPQVPAKSIAEQAGVDEQADIQAIRKLFNDFCEAHKYGDGARLAEFYTEDAMLMPSDEPIVSGRRAIASRYQRDLDQFTAELITTPREIEVSGNLAFVRGTFTIKLTPRAEGENIEATFKALSILRKSTDGSWKLYCDMWNGDAPLPPKEQGMPSQERSTSKDTVPLTVATVCMNAKTEKEANLRTFASYIKEASQKGAQLIVFPEIALQQNPGWFAAHVSEDEMAYVQRTAEPIPGPSTDAIIKLAKQHGIYVIFGMTERSADGELYNTGVFLGPNGFIGKYRKRHLYAVRGGNEPLFWKPGEQVGVFDSPFGKVGLMICIEMEDHLGGELADAEADLLVTITAWRGDSDQAAAWYDRLTRSNAFEAQRWHIVSNQVGPVGHVAGYGHSRIVNANGKVVADTGNQEGLVIVTTTLTIDDVARKSAWMGPERGDKEKMPLSTEQNKLLVRRYIEEVVNTGDVEHLAEFIAPDYTEVYNNVRHALGLEGAKQHILGGRQTYDDLHLTIEQQIAEGDWVVTRATARGTHRGGWLGTKPTGKTVEITVVNIDNVIDGRIVEHGGAANMLEPLLEAGAIRVVGPGE